VGDGDPGVSALSGESLACSLCLLTRHRRWNSCLTAAVGSSWVCSQLITPLCRAQQSRSSHSQYICILVDRKVGKQIYEIMVASPILAWCSCKRFWKGVSLKCVWAYRAAEQVDSTSVVSYRFVFHNEMIDCSLFIALWCLCQRSNTVLCVYETHCHLVYNVLVKCVCLRETCKITLPKLCKARLGSG
jgi:hypothetical protein